MKIVLTEDIRSLGKAGDVVTVAAGYARNFLLPQGKALFADEKNLKAVEHQKRMLEHHLKKERAQAEQYAEKLAQLSLTLTRKAGENEKLFGSVTTADIAEALKGEGVEIDRRSIQLEEPIRSLGVYTVQVKLGVEHEAALKVWVVAE